MCSVSSVQDHHMPHRDVFVGASSTQLQPARATNYAYARRAAPCGRPTRGLHAREARLHAGFGDRDVRVRHCRGPHQNQELINSADSRMLDRSSPYLTHQRIECKTRTQGPYYGGAVRIRTRSLATGHRPPLNRTCEFESFFDALMKLNMG